MGCLFQSSIFRSSLLSAPPGKRDESSILTSEKKAATAKLARSLVAPAASALQASWTWIGDLALDQPQQQKVAAAGVLLFSFYTRMGMSAYAAAAAVSVFFFSSRFLPVAVSCLVSDETLAIFYARVQVLSVQPRLNGNG
ncbi:hypothetical protein GUJ93_ZPchr0012g21673 [Zizania palustris]|uniref:Uncharacterized protein n=1 Tax=Zizania palustris TaxID=103762 RepID=A0A8J6BPD8_ZIZPA|nr:hypothetical protein GUJ93_ZPchr0012g21673 [Zizania palustris]